MGGTREDGRVRRRLPDAVIVVAGVAIALAAIAPIALHWLTNPPDQRLVDLEVYREGGRVVLRGAPVYDLLTQPPQLLPFTYPPFAALLAVPLAWVPWPVVGVGWVLALYGALAIVVGYAFRDLIARTGRYAPITLGVLVGALAYLQPVHDQIRFGQVGLFLVALCVADCVPGRTRWPRGVLVGLATAIKLVPGVFLIYFLITGRREAAWNATLTAAAATLAGFAVLPGDSIDFWFSAVLDNDRVGATNGTTNQSLNGMLLRLYWPDRLTSVIWLSGVAVLAYFGFKLARRASLTGRSLARQPLARSAAYSAEMAGIAITGLLAVLLSPVGWIHHLVWIILVLGALVGNGRDTRRCLVAAVVWVYYVCRVPWWGTRLIGPEHGPVERFVGRVVQDGFGLAAVTLVFVLGIWLVSRLTTERDDSDPSLVNQKVGTLAS